MNARRVSVALVASLVVLGNCGSACAQVTLKAVSFQPESVVFAKHFFRWVRETNRRCAGQVEIRHVEPGAIEAPKQWYALKTGVVDVYFGPANYYRGVLAHADVLNLAQNEPAQQRRNGVWEVLNGLHNRHVNAWYLTSLLSGVQFHIYTRKPARGGRFDGLRLRSVPMYDGFLRSLGAAPRYMVAEEIDAALRDGTIDGFAWPLWGLDIFGWEKQVRFRYGPGFMNAAAPILVNLKTWRSLSDDQRACLTKMAIWLEREWPGWRAQEGKEQVLLQERAGIEFVDLGPDFGRRAEDIYWGMLKLAEPAFTAKLKPLTSN